MKRKVLMYDSSRAYRGERCVELCSGWRGRSWKCVSDRAHIHVRAERLGEQLGAMVEWVNGGSPTW